MEENRFPAPDEEAAEEIRDSSARPDAAESPQVSGDGESSEDGPRAEDDPDSAALPAAASGEDVLDPGLPVASVHESDDRSLSERDSGAAQVAAVDPAEAVSDRSRNEATPAPPDTEPGESPAEPPSPEEAAIGTEHDPSTWPAPSTGQDEPAAQPLSDEVVVDPGLPSAPMLEANDPGLPPAEAQPSQAEEPSDSLLTPGAETEEPTAEAALSDEPGDTTMTADELLGRTDAPEPAADSASQLRAVIEAIIYVTEEPLTREQIAAALQQPVEVVKELLSELAAAFDKPEHGIGIREVAGGYKMATKPEHHDAVRNFVRSLKPPLKLSLAALETLAVIAYKQPVTAPEIAEIRGVQGTGVLKTLLDRKLIAAAGRKNVIGKPILYKTTKDFLVQFGLKDLSELPSLKEFEEIRRMALTDEPVSEPLLMDAAAAREPVGDPPEEKPPAEPPPSEEPPVEPPPSGEPPVEDPPVEPPSPEEPPAPVQEPGQSDRE